MRHPLPASVALLSLLALPVLFVANSHAQINGAPSSVTSPGFGGRAINGAPASVTSLGRNGYAPSSQVIFSTSNSTPTGSHPHHHHYVQYTPPVIYAVPVPYAVDISATDDDAESPNDDANYQGGPTIFDRRGSGADSYIPPVRNVPTPHAAQNVDVDPAPAPEPTLLIFKDGHKIEVGNYAIVGPTLFDLTTGHARKVPLADLDLQATQHQNEDRGVTFQIPQLPQAN